jgi:hypothetical protein
MLGSLCVIGSSSTWLQESPAKTGRDITIGYIPHSPHGCFLKTGQASRKFHRTIAGGFDHSLFAPDFMEHEFLFPRDVSLTPPSFILSLAALIHCGSYLLLFRSNHVSVELSKSSDPGGRVLVAGGSDVENALLVRMQYPKSSR